MARHAFDKINLPHFTFHSLRHTHATMLVKAGIHFKIIQHRLGHSSFNVTMDTYSHVTPEMDRQAVQIIRKNLIIKVNPKTNYRKTIVKIIHTIVFLFAIFY